jgi:hypothetical protein
VIFKTAPNVVELGAIPEKLRLFGEKTKLRLKKGEMNEAFEDSIFQ